MLGRFSVVADIHVVAVDPDGHGRPPVGCLGRHRDGAGRHYPVHLDTVLDPLLGEWWGDRFGLARPPETFHRDRARRDAQRARSKVGGPRRQVLVALGGHRSCLTGSPDVFGNVCAVHITRGAYGAGIATVAADGNRAGHLVPLPALGGGPATGAATELTALLGH